MEQRSLTATLFSWVLPLGACVSVATAGCSNASASDKSHAWVQIARDANYTIAIDTSRAARRTDGWFVVWYRTDHAVTHLHHGKPFNREIVQSFLRCDNLSFKIISVDMSLGAHAPISEQRTGPGELSLQPWRKVERGTVEEV